MKKLLIIFALMTISLSLVNASEFPTINQNNNFTLTITSNNATSCNLSSINYPDGTISIYNIPLTKDGKTFYLTILSSNYSQTGNICHNVICTDGLNYETGSICRTITNSNSTYFIILLALASLFFISSLFVNEEFFVYISGVLFVIAGIYTMINGIDTINDWYSRAIAYVCLGIGFLFTIGAYIYNSYNKYSSEEE